MKMTFMLTADPNIQVSICWTLSFLLSSKKQNKRPCQIEITGKIQPGPACHSSVITGRTGSQRLAVWSRLPMRPWLLPWRQKQGPWYLVICPRSGTSCMAQQRRAPLPLGKAIYSLARSPEGWSRFLFVCHSCGNHLVVKADDWLSLLNGVSAGKIFQISLFLSVCLGFLSFTGEITATLR